MRFRGELSATNTQIFIDRLPDCFDKLKTQESRVFHSALGCHQPPPPPGMQHRNCFF